MHVNTVVFDAKVNPNLNLTLTLTITQHNPTPNSNSNPNPTPNPTPIPSPIPNHNPNPNAVSLTSILDQGQFSSSWRTNWTELNWTGSVYPSLILLYTQNVKWKVHPFTIFTCDSIYAIARICHGNSVCLSVHLSVCPSVRHTGGSVKNGWS